MKRLLAPVIAILCPACIGVNTPPSISPQESQQILRDIALTRGYSRGLPSHISITPDGQAILFLLSDGKSRVQNLYAWDTATRQCTTLLSAQALLGGTTEKLTPEEKARRERMRVTSLGITDFTLSEDGKFVLIPMSGKLHVLERKNPQPVTLAGIDQVTDARFSPDARYVSYIRDHDLYICEWRTGAITRMTTGGSELLTHGEAEFVAQEEMARMTGYWWSPDSKQIAFEEADAHHVERLYIADPTTPYQAPQSWSYPRAGKTNATVRLGILTVPTAAAKEPPTPHWINWDHDKYPYLTTVRWSKNAPLCMLVMSREQQDASLFRVDPANATTQELLHEHDNAWLNLQQAMPMWLEKGPPSFLWMDESDGEWRLSLHNGVGCGLGTLNTDNSFRLRSVVHVDEQRHVIIVSGSDRAPESHLYELSLNAVPPGEKASPPKRLTASPGIHTRIYAKHGAIYVSRFEGMHAETPYEIFRADGTRLGELPSHAVKPPFEANVELLEVTAPPPCPLPIQNYGCTGPFDAAIVRPRNFVKNRKYPVIVSVYGGPHANVIHSVNRAYLQQQWFADQGFIVVSADNRGTPNRGRAWERSIYGDFGEIPLDDQVAALRAMGAKYPELDLTRVGIMGWSFGGYMSALAVCKRGDVFHAAAAGAPVVDWTDYDTFYTERYLGLPQKNAAGYARSSILTYAAGLHRPLLLIHGTADDNVYFGNSLKLADALFRAGRRFEFTPLKGYTHMVPDPDMTIRVQSRIAAFFRENLINTKTAPSPTPAFNEPITTSPTLAAPHTRH